MTKVAAPRLYLSRGAILPAQIWTGSVAGAAAAWRSVVQKLNYFLRK